MEKSLGSVEAEPRFGYCVLDDFKSFWALCTTTSLQILMSCLMLGEIKPQVGWKPTLLQGIPDSVDPEPRFGRSRSWVENVWCLCLIVAPEFDIMIMF